jgi:hypothetical protein
MPPSQPPGISPRKDAERQRGAVVGGGKNRGKDGGRWRELKKWKEVGILPGRLDIVRELPL